MISVIVPAYNAACTIRTCINALLDQGCPEETEILVVNDGSIDETAKIVSEFSAIRLITQENSGPAKARNRGAAEAAGDIILFTDADCSPLPDWISEMVRPFSENPEIVGVKGAYRTNQQQLVARFVQLEYEDKYSCMLNDRYIDFIDTYSAAFKRDIFLDMGGYDTDFPVACAEDVELSFRLSNRGYKMVFNPRAIVYHIHPDSLKAYLHKKYKFAFWRMVAVQKNPNKALRDSHTPQMMKLQLLFPPAIAASVIWDIITRSDYSLPLILLALFILLSAPWAVKAAKKDFVTGVISPPLLLLRATAQFLGVAGGTIKSLKNLK